MAVEVRATVTIDDVAMYGFLGTRVLGGVQQAMDRVRDMAKEEISAAGRVRTGEMREGVRSEPATLSGTTVSGRVVATAAHSGYQHEGTANDGQGFIYPTRSRVLRFRSRSGVVVFAAKVRGVKGHPFLTLALERLSPSDFV